MYSQAIGGVIQSAVRMAKEVWWHKVLKDLASIAAKESSREGIRWFRSAGRPFQG